MAKDHMNSNEYKLIMGELKNIAEKVDGVKKHIDDHLVTKDQLKLHVSTAMQELHKDVIDPIQKKISSNEMKSNWALRFVTVTLSAIGLAVLGAVLKSSLGI